MKLLVLQSLLGIASLPVDAERVEVQQPMNGVEAVLTDDSPLLRHRTGSVAARVT